MTDLRTAAQQALEALGLAKLNGKSGLHPAEIEEIAGAITALRAALAEPVQEPASDFERGFQRGWQRAMRDRDRDALVRAKVEAELAATVKRLAEPVQEPVVNQQLTTEPVGVVTSMVKGGVTWRRWPADMPDGTKLYAAPPQRKP